MLEEQRGICSVHFSTNYLAICFLICFMVVLLAKSEDLEREREREREGGGGGDTLLFQYTYAVAELIV